MTHSPPSPNGAPRLTPRPTEICDLWDVVRVPFPYTNRAVEQYRPALIVAALNQDGMPRLLWILMITTAIHRAWPGDVAVSNLAVAGLPEVSIVRTAKIATIHTHRADRLGVLAHGDRAEVSRRLRAAMAFDAV